LHRNTLHIFLTLTYHNIHHAVLAFSPSQQIADMAGSDIVQFGCSWYTYQIILCILSRATINKFSLTKQLNQFYALKTCPVAAVNARDDLLLKMTFLVFFKVQ